MPATHPSSPPPRPLAYSPADAARLLGISRGRMYQLLEDGSIASVKLGRLRRIRHGELDAYLDRLEAAAS